MLSSVGPGARHFSTLGSGFWLYPSHKVHTVYEAQHYGHEWWLATRGGPSPEDPGPVWLFILSLSLWGWLNIFPLLQTPHQIPALIIVGNRMFYSKEKMVLHRVAPLLAGPARGQSLGLDYWVCLFVYPQCPRMLSAAMQPCLVFLHPSLSLFYTGSKQKNTT